VFRVDKAVGFNFRGDGHEPLEE